MASITKKHFEAVAANLQVEVARIKRLHDIGVVSANTHSEVLLLLERVASDLGKVFEAANPAFDAQRFFTAAGLPDAGWI